MSWELLVALMLVAVGGFMAIDSGMTRVASRRRKRLVDRADEVLGEVLGFCARSYQAKPCDSCGESAAELLRFSESGGSAQVTCRFCRSTSVRRLLPGASRYEAQRLAEKFGEVLRLAKKSESGEDELTLSLAIPSAAEPPAPGAARVGILGGATDPQETAAVVGAARDAVLCPFCREVVARDLGRCPQCNCGLLLQERFLLERVLGQGTQGVTFLAADLSVGRKVVVKEVFLRPPFTAKTIDLFEQGLSVHRELAHPGIPRFVDAFRVAHPGLVSFYHVREHVEGETLAAILESGIVMASRDVLVLARELLEVLAYMHTCVPPVIHRDIKPSNIIRRGSDGRGVLVDFGIARRIDGSGGSTIAGTPGYAAWEQLVGEACAQSDLYSLGVTLVVLLTRRPPEALRDARDPQRIAWPSDVACDSRFRDVIRALIEPDLELRCRSAAVALEKLRGVRD